VDGACSCSTMQLGSPKSLACRRLAGAASAVSVLTQGSSSCFLPPLLPNPREHHTFVRHAGAVGFSDSFRHLGHSCSPVQHRSRLRRRQYIVGRISQNSHDILQHSESQKDDQARVHPNYVATILRLLFTFGSGYFVFGTRAIAHLTEVVSPYPWLEFITFCLLALIPFMVAKLEVVTSGIDAVIEHCIGRVTRTRGKHSVLAHCVGASRRPVRGIIKSVLYFCAFDLFVHAVPDGFSMRVPKILRFMDKNGDGILEAAEIEEWIYLQSSKVLLALWNTHIFRYLLLVKKPPVEWSPERSFNAETALAQYWTLTTQSAGGVWRLLDYLTTIVLVMFIVRAWARAAGACPQAVFTTGGAAALAMGLGARSFASNGVAAFFILATRLCKAGDKVEVGMPELRYKGVVTEIGWNSTALLHEDGSRPYTVFVPNTVMLMTPMRVYRQCKVERSRSSERAWKAAAHKQNSKSGLGRMELLHCILFLLASLSPFDPAQDLYTSQSPFSPTHRYY